MTLLRGDANRFIRIWVTITFALLLTVAGLTVTNVRTSHVAAQAKQAAAQANRTGAEVKAATACINSLLGDRGPLTTADSNAEIDLFTRIFEVLFASPKDQPALYESLLDHARPDIATLQGDKAKRDVHPLGLC